MVSQITIVGLAIAIPITVLCLGAIILAYYRHQRYQERQRKLSHESSLADSFPPSPGVDERDWSHVALQPLPSRPPNSPFLTDQGTFALPQNTEQSISFLRIGRPGGREYRDRLQSVASTLSQHTSQTKPSDTVGQVRADRIGSVDDPSLVPQRKRRNTSVTYLDEAGRKKSGSTIASSTSGRTGSFSMEHARRASMSVRKISTGGSEELVPVAIVEAESMNHPTPSPVDLDPRFAKPLSDGNRPPSRIDFSQPLGNPAPSSRVALQSSVNSESLGKPQRDSLMPSAAVDKRMSIEPALPSSKVCSPAHFPPDRSSIQLLGQKGSGKLGIVPASPVDQPKSELTQPKEGDSGKTNEGNRETYCSSSSKTSKRSNSSRKKRRPDSIDLAMTRSPKLAVHHADHLTVPSPSPPPLTAALNDLKTGIASSVLALQSANTSAHFPFSVPSTPSPKTLVPRTPRTPRTATSEGGHSVMSDIESAQLFQAWRGFRAPPTPENPMPVRRAFSVQDPGVRPRTPKRATSNDGELAVEVVTPTQSRPFVDIDFSKRLSESKAELMTLGTRSPDCTSSSSVKSQSSTPQPTITGPRQEAT